MRRLTVLVAILLAVVAHSCSGDESSEPNPTAEPGATPRDGQPDGLFADFMDGKFDSAGHPTGAQVFEAEGDCGFDTGFLQEAGLGADPGRSGPGLLCKATTRSLGQGTFTASARLLMQEAPVDGEVAVVRVLDQDGQELGSRTVSGSDFPEALVYQNVAVSFRSYKDSPAVIEVEWLGSQPVRLDYVEVFRATTQLVIEPVSGVLAEGSDITIEMVDPPTDVTYNVLCDETPLTDRLAALIDEGTATVQDTEFRQIVTVPAAALLEGCPLPTRVRVSAMTGSGWARDTSRVTYFDEPAPCEYEGDAEGTKVLITGFEPFPADSFRDNSSEKAVSGFDPAAVSGVQVLKMILPVEYDTAPALLADAIERCEPDIVVGFGQGRSAVDLETIAYNRKDTAAVSGGVPDNRGIIYGGEPIDTEGDAERKTMLPATAIVSALVDAGIRAGESDDPGRYVCNNLFYTIMGAIDPSVTVGGFVHLPRIPAVDEQAQAELETTVEVVVRNAVASRQAL